MEVALSLGSNLGDRIENLKTARHQLADLAGLRVVQASPVYETEPVDVSPEFKDRPFLNAILIVESGVPLDELARRVHAIEDGMGRVRSADRNEPRVIDIDIICAGIEHYAHKELTVPHPRWKERRFVVQPLADVRPDWVLPGETRTTREVLESLPENPGVRLCMMEWGRR